MKKLAAKTLALALIALFSISALAADKVVKKELSLSSPTLVGEKVLPAGTYKVTISTDSLAFFQTGVRKEKAAESTVKITTEKADKKRTNLMNYTTNDQKQLVLIAVTFGGQDTKYVIAK